jgi:hypothetical protein
VQELGVAAGAGAWRRRGVAFSAGWFALKLALLLEQGRDWEKKLKSDAVATVPLAGFFLALLLAFGSEAAMVCGDCPV